jgi:hypothetical protein
LIFKQGPTNTESNIAFTSLYCIHGHLGKNRPRNPKPAHINPKRNAGRVDALNVLPADNHLYREWIKEAHRDAEMISIHFAI